MIRFVFEVLTALSVPIAALASTAVAGCDERGGTFDPDG